MSIKQKIVRSIDISIWAAGIIMLISMVGTCSAHCIMDSVYRSRYREGNFDISRDNLTINRFGTCELDRHHNCFSYRWEVLTVTDHKSGRIYKFNDYDNDGKSDDVSVYEPLEEVGMRRIYFKHLDDLNSLGGIDSTIKEVYQTTRESVEQKLQKIEKLRGW